MMALLFFALFPLVFLFHSPIPIVIRRILFFKSKVTRRFGEWKKLCSYLIDLILWNPQSLCRHIIIPSRRIITRRMFDKNIRIILSLSFGTGSSVAMYSTMFVPSSVQCPLTGRYCYKAHSPCNFLPRLFLPVLPHYNFCNSYLSIIKLSCWCSSGVMVLDFINDRKG
jgi:hypothetical protein